MQALVMIAISAAAAALILVFSARRASFAETSTRQPRSPIDHAERILATRYARGLITPDEYERMLAVLRH